MMSVIAEETVESLRGLVSHIVEEIVDHPDEVEVNVIAATHRLLVELTTNEGDVGQVIGQGGYVVTGLRSIISAFGGRHRIQTAFDFVTEQRGARARRPNTR